VLSGVTTGLSWLAYFRALQLGPASRVAPIDKLSRPLTMVLAWLFLGEALTLKSTLAVALMVAGEHPSGSPSPPLVDRSAILPGWLRLHVFDLYLVVTLARVDLYLPAFVLNVA
jgi:hypothetical protein